VTSCAPTLYEGSVIEHHEDFLFWQGSCLQSQFVLYHDAFPPGWVLPAKLKFRAFMERSHTYVRTSTACILTKISFYHTYREILTDTDQKIPIRDATLLIWYPTGNLYSALVLHRNWCKFYVRLKRLVQVAMPMKILYLCVTVSALLDN
jgi:hypothetical protein